MIRRVARQSRRELSRLRRYLVARPIILMYHRVAELRLDPQLLAVRPTYFAEQLDLLRTSYRILSLAQLTAAVRHDRLPRRTVILTIDDGYSDSLVNAKPLLERAEAPASVFVTTGQIGQSREFWWDELERLVLEPGVLPAELRLSLVGTVREWQLGDGAEYGEEDLLRDRWWHVEQPHDPGPRQRLYRSLYALLHPLPDAEKWRVLGELQLLRNAQPAGRATHRALTQDEVLRLADGGLIQIGAHSATHPALAGLPVSAQADEIEASKATLEELLDRSVTSFAYPHGSYTPETVAAVREAGFECACSSDPYIVERHSDVLRLPRVVPRDWDGDTFGRWLRDWTG